jgi:hypothetical protein
MIAGAEQKSPLAGYRLRPGFETQSEEGAGPRRQSELDSGADGHLLEVS